MEEFSGEAFRELLFKLAPDDAFYIMEHDLRTPLANIVSALSLLQDHPNHPLADDEYAMCISIIERSSQQLESMVGGALDYGRTIYQKCKDATESPA